jgi:MerR family copper efflux transcriptional regulator
MDSLTIGTVAEQAGVNVQTIRFYERQGLIESPPRTPSGYRQYPKEVIKRIHFIQSAKELGFTLKEVNELLSLRVQPGSACNEVKDRALAKILDIDQKLDVLTRMKNALTTLTSACEHQRAVGDCPVLEAIEGGIPR